MLRNERSTTLTVFGLHLPHPWSKLGEPTMDTVIRSSMLTHSSTIPSSPTRSSVRHSEDLDPDQLRSLIHLNFSTRCSGIIPSKIDDDVTALTTVHSVPCLLGYRLVLYHPHGVVWADSIETEEIQGCDLCRTNRHTSMMGEIDDGCLILRCLALSMVLRDWCVSDTIRMEMFTST